MGEINFLRITNAPKVISSKVQLPSSKSISNRALIIQALCKQPFIIQNLSDADDTALMQSLFQSREKELYVKNAGTVARFLLAFLATQPGCDIILKGSDRMNERPINELVNALKNIGAEVEYREREGFLPVHIRGKALKGGHVTVSASTSSQFISALLLIGPMLKEGLTLELEGEIVSKPYINLTLQLMAYFGIKYQQQSNVISIPSQEYTPRIFFVESDWSSASYFYALVALYPGSTIEFDNLFSDSWQGDSLIKELMAQFGHETSFIENKCIVNSFSSQINHFQFDFIDYPDLIPTFVCLCCAKQIPFQISGTKTLKYKESDRAEVLKTELEKLGYSLHLSENAISFDGIQNQTDTKEIKLNTHHDHRMAMSFSILASQNGNILIENPEVTEKSFPGFWSEINRLGFETHQLTNSPTH
jgi:3-phosphoshikimate 1-carboxyvinyltransferase